VLGDKHPHFAESLNNLARIYQNKGDYKNAEPLYKQVLELLREKKGEKHLSFARGLSNLAGLYFAQKDYAKAETTISARYANRA